MLVRMFRHLYKSLLEGGNRAIWLVLAVVLIYMLGVVGIYYFEHGENDMIKSREDALYWGVITMSTIGYGDIYPVTSEGRMITVVFAILGISAFAVAASALFEFIVTRNVRRLLGMERCDWENHIVICGWNETAKSTLRELRANDPRPVVIVDPGSVEDTSDEVLHVKGDYWKENVLRKAAGAKADFGLVSTGDDSRTIITILLLRRINKDIQIVAEALDEGNGELMKQAGALVVNSSSFGGRLLASFVFEDGVTRLFEELSTSSFGNDVFEFPSPHAGTFGELLTELKKERNIIIVGIKAKDAINANPPWDHEIDEGETLMALGVENNETTA
ncbi:MAG: NAD-binding protein [Candidatus Undinarchaeales archaeon]|jgi:voltage-gated potassium channel|nr:NAD-binding protein [Candidatus Undinarchaeales archaeon]MDP7493417.1 NAD-binding protein [Candidatus Undinarchaeales archaeon]